LSVAIDQNTNSSKRTLFPEYDAIDVSIKIIDLLTLLHDNNIIHTDLNPSNIFLNNGNTSEMCY
jgi:serine/threonine protein kinase